MCCAVTRTYAVIGLRSQVKYFQGLSTLTFEELQRRVQVLWPFFQAVKFEVYTEGAVQDSNRRKNAGFKPLDGMELNQV